MKRQRFLRHLREHGCELDREGGNHSLYYDPATNKSAAVPRHREIDAMLMRQICKQLGIEPPAER